MDLQLFFTTFSLVFLAELGDKTQLTTMALATKPGSSWMVFLGASMALVSTSAIGVLSAELVGRYISPMWLQRVAGAGFIVMGAWTLWKAGQ